MSTAQDTLTVNTNCTVGYSVYVSATSSGNTNLTNDSASASGNNTIAPSSAAVGGTATVLSANTWGINASSSDVSDGKYFGLPAYASATASALTTRSNVAEQTTVPIYYGAKVTTAIAPGSYAGDVLYTVLSDSACNVYTIEFDANGGTGEMDNQTINVGQATALNKNEFTREGYTFLGWSTESTGKTGTAVDGVGTAEDVDYENEASVTDISGFNTTKTLYAIWEASADGDMQSFVCTSIASGATAKLRDTRDGQIYSVYRIPTNATYYGTSTVANIAGKCIMTKDLNLGAVNSVSGASSSITAQGTMNLSPADSAFSTPTGSGESITVPTTTTAVTHGTPGTGDNYYTNRQYRIDGTGNYAGRGYYTWGAAMLACPKNWRLPTADEYSNSTSWEGQTAGLAAIVKGANYSTTISNITSSPWSFVLGGYYTSGFVNAGSNGYYWSTTQYGSTDSYILRMRSSSGLGRSNFNKSYGFAVRCIAQNNYTVSYNANGGTGAASKASDAIYETGTFTTAGQGTLAKEGYNFLGWSLDQNATTATYSANTAISVPDLITAAGSPASGSTITLYAVWGIPDDGNLGTMQSFNCANLTPGHTATVTDSRDNQAYGIYRIPTNATYYGTSTVANIAGKCIMTKDLNLGAVNSVSGASSSITANGTMTLSPLDSSFSTPTGSGESITVPTSNVTVSMTWSTSDSYSNRHYHTNGTGDHAGRGYYSWGAAMVACPKNWRLPTSDEYSNSESFEGSTTGLSAIVKGANASTTISNITSSPWSFVLGGYYNNGFNYAGSNGYYWSTTQYNSTSPYGLRLSSSGGLVRSGGSKRLGFAVRCIAGEAMQGFNPSELSNVGDSKTLTDVRDSKEYTVKKLPDGKIWMMQNLTIGSDGAKTLTSADTNIDNNTTYYLPPAGMQGDITSSSTLTSNTAANFSTSDDNQAKTQFRTKDSSITNDSDTGYYNFYTATLGYSYYQTSGSGAGISQGSSTRDICPKGWRLPKTTDSGTNVTTTGSANDFTYLARQYSTSGWSGSATGTSGYGYYNNTDAVKGPMYTSAAANGNKNAGFSYAGVWEGTNTSASYVGSRGLYWSSSVYNTGYGYSLHFDSSYVYPQSILYFKNVGYAVRCIQGKSSMCFTAGTQIQTTMDGETKAIEDIKIGEEVVSYDPEKHEYYMTEVLGTIIHDGEERSTRLAKLTLKNGTTLEMTQNHPILTKDGYKALQNDEYPVLTKDDIIVTTTGEYEVSSIDIYDTEPTIVYNLNVKGREGDTANGLTHSYIANGVVVHNKAG